MNPVAPSGEQYRIRSGDQEATIVEVGGGVREYSVGDRAALDSYPVGAMCDGAHGTPLIPWPNRLAGGRYAFDGAEYQVDLTEPAKQNAIHGFLRRQPWQARRHEEAGVVMGTRIYPREGYPFALEVSVDYRLGPDGLVVTTTATNIGDRRAPYGTGQHPYLSPGRGLIDGCVLRFAAATRILTDSEHQVPIGSEPVAGTALDFGGDGRPVGDLQVDSAFRDLTRDPDGRAWVRLTGPDGRTVSLWADGHHPVIQIYTGDTLAPERRRLGLAAEPMTCPPNAFRTGENLLVLDVGASVTTTWGVRLD